LIFFLFSIARFYQEKSGQRSYYPVYFIPITLFVVAALIYAWPAATPTATFWANVMRFVAALTLVGAGRFLLKLMIGK